MRYEVPQFIDIKDKIFWSLTFMQGIYLAGGFFGGFMLFYLIGMIFPDAGFVIKIIPGVPIFAFGAALAFVEINKRPFVKYLEAWFYYLIHPKRYNWKKQDAKKNSNSDMKIMHEGTVYQIANQDYTQLSKRSKIKDIANILDMDA